MPTYNLSLDISPLIQTLAAVDEVLRINIANAVAQAANCIENEWKTKVRNAPGVWVGEKDAYFESIKTKEISPFEIEIYSDYKIAAEIETGRPARDLKRMLDTSTKVRVSAKGVRYLIIPFRHNTPGSDALSASMPKDVYKIAKQMQLSSITGTKWQANGAGGGGIYTERNTYAWGAAYSKLNKKHTLIPARIPAGMMGPNPQGRVDRFAGMVRMKDDSANNRAGGYLTFRVMTSNSNGWIIPAKPGLFLVRGIVDAYTPQFEKLLADACTQQP